LPPACGFSPSFYFTKNKVKVWLRNEKSPVEDFFFISDIIIPMILKK